MKKRFYLAISMLAAFALWTCLVCCADVQAIGPRGSVVGFASINGFFHELTGVHMWLYTVTDWAGLVPVVFCLGFAALGLIQWIKRKKIWKVDFSILVLGGYYILVLALYLLFEEFVLNYRPVLIDGYLEASYPSSTTLLVLCVMPTANMQLKQCTKHRFIPVAINVFTVFMVIGRLISGVHWLSDIIGGVLLGAGLVMLYNAVVKTVEK